MTTAQIRLTTLERQNQVKKKFCLQIKKSPNRTDNPRETELGETKEKVLPSDDDSPNKTDYPRETEPGEKKEGFCLQITKAQIGLTTQERQPGEKKEKVLPSDNKSPNRIDYPRETEPGEKK